MGNAIYPKNWENARLGFAISEKCPIRIKIKGFLCLILTLKNCLRLIGNVFEIIKTKKSIILH